MVDTEYFAKKMKFDRTKSLGDYKYKYLIL